MKTFYRHKKHNITIISTQKLLIKKVEKAVLYIKKINQNYFKQVYDNLPVIFIIPGKGHLNAYFINDGVWFIMSGGVKEDHLIYLASLLIHESQHMVQFKKNKKYYGTVAEKDAYLKQRDFFKSVPDEYLSKWFIQWLDKQYKKKWWKQFGKEMSSKDCIFEKFLSDYKKNKISFKKYF